MSTTQRDLKVTIITPTYNQAPYIKQCIESIRCQTYGNYEHLIYDAMSLDGTDDIIRSYADDPRIVHVREKDRGASDAINKGLEAASGDIVCWLNSDDTYFDPHVLKRIVSLFEDHPDMDAVTGCGYYIAENGSLLSPCVMPNAAEISYRGMRRTDYFLQPSTFWRRNELRLDEKLSFCYDWKLFLDFYKHDMAIMYVPEYFSKYRLQPQSKTFLDTAERRGEVVWTLRYAGAGSLQIGWARFIHLCYMLSEFSRLPFLRKASLLLNRAAHRMTCGRIFSP